MLPYIAYMDPMGYISLEKYIKNDGFSADLP